MSKPTTARLYYDVPERMPDIPLDAALNRANWHIWSYLNGRYFDQNLHLTNISRDQYLKANFGYVADNIKNGLHKCTEHCIKESA